MGICEKGRELFISPQMRFFSFYYYSSLFIAVNNVINRNSNKY